MVKKSLVSAPGKIIISGEHSVVYGQPALLSAINKRLYVQIEENNQGVRIMADEPTELAEYALEKTREFLGERINHLKIKIKSEVPVNRGLGSSAALSVAMVGALFRWVGREWNKSLINQLALTIEKKQHQNPSGGDNSVSCFGGLMAFQQGKIRRLKTKFDFQKFILIDSGQAIESTGEMVAGVGRKFQAPNSKTQKILDELGKITLRFIEEFKDPRHFDYSKCLISKNQRLLEKLGVVGKKAQRLVRLIEEQGGAAKICGAGGVKEGSGVLLCYHQNPKILLDFTQKEQIPYFKLKLGEEGLRDEN